MRREEKERGEAGRTVDDRRVEWSEEGEESRYGRDEGRADYSHQKGPTKCQTKISRRTLKPDLSLVTNSRRHDIS